MALALYRTYRPGTLAEVIGQEHVTEPLARALASERIHHAYLFSGPRGCGKTSTARILARSLNCEQGPTPTPCGQCRSCLDLAPNGPGSIDVVELDAATHRGIDDARDLREKAIYAPASSRFRVYIIDEAHQLTNEAANALLKLVEEPPPHLRFVFATTEPDKIIPTIRSRTFHYPFRLVPARTLAEHLATVCASEGVPADPSALAMVARAGAGSVRDSLSVLGQLLAGAGPDGLTRADAVVALGLTDESLIDGFVEALAAGSAADMFTVVDGVISAGHDPRRFVADVLDRLRDLIVLRADPGAVESGLVEVPDDAGERLGSQARSLRLAELSRAADLVSAGLSEIKGATAPRLQLELLCARLALPGSGTDLGSVLARLDQLERAVSEDAGRARRDQPQPTGSEDAGRARRDESQSTVSEDAGRARRDQPQSTGSEDAGRARRDQPQSTGSEDAGRARRDQPQSTVSEDAGRARRDQTAPAEPGDRPPAPPTRPTLRSRGGATTPPADASTQATPAPQATPTPAAAVDPDRADAQPQPEAGTASLAQVQSAWAKVLERLAGDSRVAWAVFESSRPLSVTGGSLAVAIGDVGRAAAIRAGGHDIRLRTALLDVLQLDVAIDVVHDPGAAASGRKPDERPGPQGRPGPPGRQATQAQTGSGGAPQGHPGPVGTDVPKAPDSARTAPAGSTGGPPAATGTSATPTSPAGAKPAATGSGVPPVGPPARGRLAALRAQVDEVRDEAPDEPSDDDPDLTGLDGLALITRELGARPIGEIDHS